MKLKTKIENKATDLQNTLAVQAQAKYIKWLMKEEEIDYETARAIVEYRTDPIEWEYPRIQACGSCMDDCHLQAVRKG